MNVTLGKQQILFLDRLGRRGHNNQLNVWNTEHQGRFLLGTIVHEQAIFETLYSVHIGNQLKYYIVQPCCEESLYNITDLGKERVYGCIRNHWSPQGLSSLFTGNSFGVQFPSMASNEEKAVFFAAVLLINKVSGETSYDD